MSIFDRIWTGTTDVVGDQIDLVTGLSKSLWNIGSGTVLFAGNTIGAGGKLVTGKPGEAAQALLTTVQEDLQGKVLGGVFGPGQTGIGGTIIDWATIGDSDSAFNRQARGVTGAAFGAWDWVTQNVVDAPLGTVATVGAAALQSGGRSFFDLETYSKAWQVNRDDITFGQAVTYGLFWKDAFSETDRAAVADDPVFNLISGAIDLAQEFIDPVTYLGGSALKLARGTTVTGRYGRTFSGGVSRSAASVPITPDVRLSGTGLRPSTLGGARPKPGSLSSLLVKNEKQYATAQEIAANYTAIRTENVINSPRWQELNNVIETERAAQMAKIGTDPDTGQLLSRVQNGNDRYEIMRRSGFVNNMNRETVRRIANGATPEARSRSLRMMIGDAHVFNVIYDDSRRLFELLNSEDGVKYHAEASQSTKLLKEMSPVAREIRELMDNTDWVNFSTFENELIMAQQKGMVWNEAAAVFEWDSNLKNTLSSLPFESTLLALDDLLGFADGSVQRFVAGSSPVSLKSISNMPAGNRFKEYFAQHADNAKKNGTQYSEVKINNIGDSPRTVRIISEDVSSTHTFHKGDNAVKEFEKLIRDAARLSFEGKRLWKNADQAEQIIGEYIALKLQGDYTEMRNLHGRVVRETMAGIDEVVEEYGLENIDPYRRRISDVHREVETEWAEEIDRALSVTDAKGATTTLRNFKNLDPHDADLLIQHGFSPKQMEGSSVNPRFDIVQDMLKLEYGRVSGKFGSRLAVNVFKAKRALDVGVGPAMQGWRAAVLLTPKWPMRVALDEQLRIAANIGAAGAMVNFIDGWTRLRRAGAAHRLPEGMKVLDDADAIAEAVQREMLLEDGIDYGAPLPLKFKTGRLVVDTNKVPMLDPEVVERMNFPSAISPEEYGEIVDGLRNRGFEVIEEVADERLQSEIEFIEEARAKGRSEQELANEEAARERKRAADKMAQRQRIKDYREGRQYYIDRVAEINLTTEAEAEFFDRMRKSEDRIRKEALAASEVLDDVIQAELDAFEKNLKELGFETREQLSKRQEMVVAGEPESLAERTSIEDMLERKLKEYQAKAKGLGNVIQIVTKPDPKVPKRIEALLKDKPSVKQIVHLKTIGGSETQKIANKLAYVNGEYVELNAKNTARIVTPDAVRFVKDTTGRSVLEYGGSRYLWVDDDIFGNPFKIVNPELTVAKRADELMRGSKQKELLAEKGAATGRVLERKEALQIAKEERQFWVNDSNALIDKYEEWVRTSIDPRAVEIRKRIQRGDLSGMTLASKTGDKTKNHSQVLLQMHFEMYQRNHPFNIFVGGSRDFGNYELMSQKLDNILMNRVAAGNDIVLHYIGTNRSMTETIKRYAKENNLRTVEHRPMARYKPSEVTDKSKRARGRLQDPDFPDVTPEEIGQAARKRLESGLEQNVSPEKQIAKELKRRESKENALNRQAFLEALLDAENIALEASDAAVIFKDSNIRDGQFLINNVSDRGLRSRVVNYRGAEGQAPKMSKKPELSKAKAQAELQQQIEDLSDYYDALAEEINAELEFDPVLEEMQTREQTELGFSKDELEVYDVDEAGDVIPAPRIQDTPQYRSENWVKFQEGRLNFLDEAFIQELEETPMFDFEKIYEQAGPETFKRAVDRTIKDRVLVGRNKTKLLRNAGIRVVLGIGVGFNPALGAAWGFANFFSNSRRVRVAGQQKAALTYASALRTQGRMMLETVSTQAEISAARSLMTDAEYIEKLVEEERASALNIQNAFDRADELMEEAGFPGLSIHGVKVDNAFGNDQRYIEQITAQNSASASMSAIYSNSYSRAARTNQRASTKMVKYDVLNAPKAPGKEDAFGIKYESLTNVFTQSSNTEPFFKVVWGTENPETRVQMLRDLLIENKKLRGEILKDSRPSAYGSFNGERSFIDAVSMEEIARDIINEVDNILPPEYFPATRAKARSGRFTWNDVEKEMKQTVAAKHKLKKGEDYVEPTMEETVKLIRNGVRGPRREAFGMARAPEDIADSTRSKIKQKSDKLVSNLFEKWGALPADELGRHPFFRTNYEAEIRAKLNVLSELSDDGSVEISQKTLFSLQAEARETAMQKTKDVLYELNRQSRFSEMLGNASPFFNAWQEVITRWAGFAVENPFFVANMTRLYRKEWSAEALGLTQVEDDNGNKYIVFKLAGDAYDADGNSASILDVMPESIKNTFIPERLRDPNRNIRFSKDGLNTMLTGTPGAGPLITVPLKEAIIAEPKLEEVFGFLFPYGYGNQDSLVGRVFLDNAPTWTKSAYTAITGRVSNDVVVARMFQDITLEMAARGEPFDFADRDMYIEVQNEAERRARNFDLFRVAAGFFSPTSTTMSSVWQPYIDEFNNLRRKHGTEKAQTLFIDYHGEEFFAATAYMSNSMDGVVTTIDAESMARKHKDLVDAHPQVGAWISGSVGSAAEKNNAFSLAAYNSQKRRGARTQLTGLEAISNSDADLGWRKYSELNDWVRTEQDRYAAAGMSTSLNASHLRDVAFVKQQYVERLRAEHPAWAAEFSNINASNERMSSIVEGFAAGLKVPEIVNRPSSAVVIEYLRLRMYVQQQLMARESVGGSLFLESDQNEDLLRAWEVEKNKLSMNTTFSEIYDRFFENDKIHPETFMSSDDFAEGLFIT